MADTASGEGVGLPEPATLSLVGDEDGGSQESEVSTASEGAPEGVTDEGGEGEGEQAAPGSDQAKSLFQNLIEQDETPDEKTEEELPPEVEKNSRAAEAIKGLRARAQRSESEHANLQASFAQSQRQWNGWAQQVQKEYQALREEYIRLQASAQHAPQVQPGPKTEAEQYIDQLRASITQQVVDQYVKPIQQQLQERDQRWDQFSSQREQEQRQARAQADAQVFQTEAANYWRKTVLREVPEDVQVPDVGKYLVLAAQAYNPQLAADPEGAARMIRRTILETADLIQRHAGKPAQTAVNKGKQTTASVPRSGADGATREANPSMDLLLHNGFDTPMDWKEAGRPRLKALPKSA